MSKFYPYLLFILSFIFLTSCSAKNQKLPEPKISEQEAIDIVRSNGSNYLLDSVKDWNTWEFQEVKRVQYPLHYVKDTEFDTEFDVWEVLLRKEESNDMDVVIFYVDVLSGILYGGWSADIAGGYQAAISKEKSFEDDITKAEAIAIETFYIYQNYEGAPPPTVSITASTAGSVYSAYTYGMDNTYYEELDFMGTPIWEVRHKNISDLKGEGAEAIPFQPRVLIVRSNGKVYGTFSYIK